MIWRLMATILAVSDTGSISLVATHTDWPTEQQCRELLVSHYTPPPPTIFNGHEITAKVSASCVLVIPPVLAATAPVGSPNWRPRPPAPPPPPMGFPFPFFR
jgi:hypothetical protein